MHPPASPTLYIYKVCTTVLKRKRCNRTKQIERNPNSVCQASHLTSLSVLPYLEDGFNNISAGIIRRVTDILDSTYASKSLDDEQGLTIWTFGNGGQVKLLRSPCYDRRIDLCRSHGELRLLPDLSLQKCIFDPASVPLKDLSIDEIRHTVSDMWSSFEQCI